MILEIFGLPEQDYAGVLRFTRAMFGTGDPSAPPPPIPPGPDLDPYHYFRRLAADRRRAPSGDLASVIANGTVDGAPLGELETLNYYIIVVTAGHDTTSSAVVGGLDALLEHPDQLAQLELSMLFERMLPRPAAVGRDGPARTDRTTFVGGHSSLPIRYQMVQPTTY